MPVNYTFFLMIDNIYSIIKGEKMQSQYTAIIKQSGNFWIGWIKEIPGVNCQEESRADLIDTLRITLSEAIDNRSQLRSSVPFVELSRYLHISSK
jgi:predicted RNase H-like HicB family nuclease